MSVAQRLRDERGIITGTLVRYAAILLVLGLVAIEGGSIAFTFIRLQNASDAAALAAADTWSSTRNLRTARRAARAELDTKDHNDATIVDIEGDGPPGFEIRLRVRKEAPTILVNRIGFLSDLGIVEIDAEARPVQPGV
jgi:Flp pilus assembly protein TadG